jgi:stringent starvation protein B
MAETSTKPYLLRALYEWASDNGYTPHIVVQVNEHCRVPAAFVRDNQITLNIAGMATGNLVIGNDYIEFQARFSGKTENISVPVGAVTAIYARETGAGMGFEVESSQAPGDVDEQTTTAPPATKDSSSDTDDKPKRPALKVVK